MDNVNMSILELVHPVMAIAPQSVAASGVASGQWLDMNNVQKLGIVAVVGTGTGTFNFTVEQATSNAGAGAKAVAFTTAITNTTDTVDAYTKITGLTNSVPATASDIVLLDIRHGQLDTDNGFTFVRVKATESGGAAAQLVSATYLAKGNRYASISAAPSELV